MLTYILHTSDIVLRHSIETILWQAGEADEDGTTFEDLFAGTEPNYQVASRILADFYGFLSRVDEDALNAYLEKYYTSDLIHDYWLTRNRHGAGFWDRGLGKTGLSLTEAAQNDSEYDVFISDDTDGWDYEG